MIPKCCKINPNLGSILMILLTRLKIEDCKSYLPMIGEGNPFFSTLGPLKTSLESVTSRF